MVKDCILSLFIYDPNSVMEYEGGIIVTFLSFTSECETHDIISRLVFNHFKYKCWHVSKVLNQKNLCIRRLYTVILSDKIPLIEHKRHQAIVFGAIFCGLHEQSETRVSIWETLLNSFSVSNLN